jgi:hypothetical protein
METAAKAVPGPEFRSSDGNPMSELFRRVSRRAVMEAVDRLAAEGMVVDYMRVRAFPFAASARVHRVASEVLCRNRIATGSCAHVMIETGAARDQISVLIMGLPLTADVCQRRARWWVGQATGAIAFDGRSISFALVSLAVCCFAVWHFRRSSPRRLALNLHNLPPVRHPSLPKNRLADCSRRRDVDALCRLRA